MKIKHSTFGCFRIVLEHGEGLVVEQEDRRKPQVQEFENHIEISESNL